MRPPAGGSRDKERYTYSVPEGQALSCWPTQNRDPAGRMGEGVWALPLSQGWALISSSARLGGPWAQLQLCYCRGWTAEGKMCLRPVGTPELFLLLPLR